MRNWVHDGLPDGFPLMRIARCVAFAVVVAAGITGCGSNNGPEEIAEDEARIRARFDGLDVSQAAERYFTPRKIEDYFAGMDSVSAPADGTVAWPDQLLDIKIVPATDTSQVNEPAGGRPATRVQPPTLSESAIFGRNSWMIWCGGNEGFWDWLASENLGFIDLLKLVDSRNRGARFREAGLINEPEMMAARSASPNEFGLWLDTPANETTRAWREQYVKRTFPQIARGLHKSQRGLPVYRGERDEAPNDGYYDYPDAYMTSDDPKDYAYRHDGNEDRYKKYKQIPPPDIYGISSGVIGLRLFPNPNFTAEHQARWNAERYYTDRSYYEDPKLERPYRVGMSCAFCHASFHPLVPPRDTINPEWRNISGSIGAQYLRVRAAVGNLLKPDNFIYHLLDSQPPGTIDTSLIASDNINNPNAMNAIFRLKERAILSFRNPPELVSNESMTLPSLWRNPQANATADDPDQVPPAVRELFLEQGLLSNLQTSNKDNPRYTPRILFDGADSIGTWGAMSRVYLNIGSYWQRWNQLHQPLVGFREQRPFTLHDCRKYSVFFNATDRRVGPMRDYFLAVSEAMPLLSADGASDRIVLTSDPTPEDGVSGDALATNERLRGRRVDVSRLKHGRKVFARNCIVCHSSVQPESSAAALHAGVAGQQEYEERFKLLIKRRNDRRAEWAKKGEFWEHDPGQWLRDPEYLEWAQQIVEESAFWTRNFLSTDYRIPINVVNTNAGRALATNAVAGHIWEDFASLDYKKMPSVGPIDYFNPYAGAKGENDQFTPRHRAAPDVPPGGGGVGFYRVPTLVSIWNTAPLLHNNSLGTFNNDPSIDGRLDAFDDAICKLLWPERRLQSSSYNDATAARLQADRGLIWRTTEDSYLTVSGKYVPQTLAPFLTRLGINVPWMHSVQPLWLPSTELFVGGFLLLVAHAPVWRRRLGRIVLALALALGVGWLVATRYPDQTWSRWLLSVQPAWFAWTLLALVGIAFLAPFSWKWNRWIGCLAVALSLLVGGFVYFNAGRLGAIRLGPIPKGTPVNLIANVNSEVGQQELLKAFSEVAAGLSEIQTRHLDQNSPEIQQVMREKIAPALLRVSKCPDFVMDKGHYYEWFKTMTDDDKTALIELLKTF